MSVIKGYPTKNTGPEPTKNVTITECTDGSDKVALDVNVQKGTITSNPGDSPSEDPTTGDTLIFNGPTSDALAFSLPAVAGGVITSLIVDVEANQTSTNTFSVSYNGTDFWEMETGEHVGWTPRGGLTQITFKGNAAGVEYKIKMNRNDP